MKTRDEAIAHLSAAGLFARRHDLWLGPAIAVSREPQEVEGIRVVEGLLFIHPGDAECWCITRTQHGGDARVDVYATLDAAVAAARVFIGGN